MKLKKILTAILCASIMIPSGAMLAFAEPNNAEVSTKTQTEMVETEDASKTSEETEPSEEAEDTVKSDNSEKDEDEKNVEPKKDKSVLTIETDSNGHVIVLKGDDALRLVPTGTKEVIEVKIDDEVKIAACGKSPNLELKGAKKLSKEVSGKADDSATIYTVKITDKEAKATLSFAATKNEGASDNENGVALFASRAAALTTGKVTKIAELNYQEGSGIGRFWINAGGASLKGVCCDRHNANVAAKGNKVTLSKKSNTSALGRLAYYGYTHTSTKGQYQVSAAASYYRYGMSGNFVQCGYQTLAKKAKNGTLAAGPENFEAYVATCGSKQKMLVWRMGPNPEGKLALTKTVKSNQEIVSQCPNMYSLEGAEYSVEDSSGNKVGTLKTNANGKTNTLTLKEGTYKVKETKAPNGFALDRTVYTVRVEAGKMTSFVSKEDPIFDPTTIVLEKTATDGSYVNKDADMSGAEFTINYYDSTDDDVSNLKPIRTWKLKTINKNGRCIAQLRNEFLIKDGSDEFFLTDGGAPVIPRGQITIQETKAPIGYKVDPKIYSYVIDRNGDDMILNLGNTPEQPNSPLHPSIATTAVDVATGDNVGANSDHVVIKDKISFKELYPNKSYTVVGKLMDQKTGEDFLVDGKSITSRKTFTVVPEDYNGPTPAGEVVRAKVDGNGASGEVEVEFVIDKADLKGKSLVAFESLYFNGELISKHEDINDKNQTVDFPDVHTTLESGELGDHYGEPQEKETLIDTVACSNLVIGKEYTVNGTLMNKATGEALKDKDGKPVTAEKTFVADKTDLTVELEFVFDSSLLQGETVVAFEDLYHNDIVVATHSDLEDKDQTVEYPDCGTTAIDSELGDHTSFVDGEVKIIDTVSYKNLYPGKEYSVTGILMDKETGNPILVDGKEVTNTVKFTPEEKDGEVQVEFVFDSTVLGNKTLVAFEEISRDGKLVVTHKDLEDTNQTITTVPPEGKTILKDNLTNSKEVYAGHSVTLIDTMEYKNLYPGKEYTMTGTLMDKETGKPILVDGKEVTNTVKFTPDKPNGEVKLKFTFDASKLGGHELVAFEKISRDDRDIIIHEDINDKDQTVFVKEIPPVKTGDETNFMMFGVIGLSLALLAYTARKSKKLN